MSTMKIVVVGLGPIGVATASAVDTEQDMQLVGLVDVDRAKQGQSLNQLTTTEGENTSGIVVTDSIANATGNGADVAIVATTSYFDAIVPTVMELLDRKIAVVSSCEQMIWPWYRHGDLADQVNSAAKRAGRTVLGSGVNPGFVMDALAVMLSSMVLQVTGVHCVRRVEAATRRQPLQAKVGATMSAEQFKKLANQEKIGHKGLAESIALLAAGLGRRVEPESVHETLDPILAKQPTQSALGLIEPGRVCGIHNVGQWADDGLKISLDLTMAVGTADPHDRVELDGPVPLQLVVPGSIPGDSATVAALLNTARIAHQAQPGMLTAIDVPLPGCRGRG